MIAAHDAASTLAQTLDSVAAQTYQEWEAIVVDDGSSDDTAGIAESYAQQDRRFRVLSQCNGGTASARNLAAANARGSLIALLDADDLYLPEYLERMALFIAAHPAFDLYTMDGYLLDDSGHIALDDLLPVSSVVSYSAADFLVRNRVRVQNIFRRALFDQIGGFDEDSRIRAEDYEFWLRALLSGARHIHNPERLKIYRVAAGGKSANELACFQADQYMFQRLLASGSLSPANRSIARRTLRRLTRVCDSLVGAGIRARLLVELERGEYRGARRMYVNSRHGWASHSKYAFGLLVMLISPRVFGQMLRRYLK